MNCRQAHEYLDDLLLAGPDQETESALATHVASCAACQRECELAKRTLALLQPSVKTEASTDLKERIMMKINAADEIAPYLRERSVRRRNPWKPMLAAAAAAIVIVVGALFLVKPATPVYALEQTIAANHGLRSIHMRMTPESFGHVGEMWARFDENGDLINLRMNFPDTEDGPKDVVVENGNAQVWFKKKGLSVVVKDALAVERFRSEFGVVDPKLTVEEIYRKQADGALKVDVSEPTSKGDPITLTVTTDGAPVRKDVYLVDAATKLLLAREVYRMADNAFALEARIEYLDYNQSITDDMFILDVPANTVQVDQTMQSVGLVQGNLSDKEIAVKVVREFFTALIDKDYAKAGQLMEGLPADRMKSTYGRLDFTRIISIGEPTPYAQNQSLKVPCKVEVERGGKTTVFEPFGPFVRQVHGQPDRWTICGGI